ncbi:MAG: hypothetical protein ACLGI7_10665 [Gammaproteobacteria bacterium]
MSRQHARVAALAVAALAAGCDVGEGTAPTGITISFEGLEDGYQTYECAAFQLAATAHFEGDTDAEGDVTSRVIWTSSNPGVIDVSNGELEAEPGSGSYFPAGTVIARTAGTAVIRADYAALSDSFGVTADTIGDLRIVPELTRLAPGSQQTFELEVRFADGDPAVDLTASAVWSLPTADAPATLAGTATVQTVTDPLDRPFVLEARLFTCDRRAERRLALGAVAGLRLRYEQPEALAVPLAYTDEIRVDAAFEDASAPAQNLSGQVEIDQILGDDDYAQLTVGDFLKVSGGSADVESQFRLRYAPLDLEAVTRVYSFADTEIVSLRVEPLRTDLFYPDTLQLEAYGLFADGHERPLRRDVTWASLNEDLVSVVSGGADAGEVTPLGLEGDATVEAKTGNSEGEVEAEADIRVYVD